MAEPIRLTTAESCRDWVRETQVQNKTVGLVPTMGALHEGHLSLVEQAKVNCDKVIATIFVNPTQFGPGEDFERYPRDIESDVAKLQSVGADACFCPPVDEIYPKGDATIVDVGAVAKPWEGSFRPGHFDGVATVVLKLINLAPAEKVFFGQKDYQQTLVIKQMIRDLHVPIEVVVCPTIREPDGLAMSSRNVYLSTEERQRALVLSRALSLVQQSFSEGSNNVDELEAMAKNLIESTDGIELQYLALLAPDSIEPAKSPQQGVVAVVAAKVGKTRLIDNLVLQ